ncbi:hypothetical protein DYB32_004491 [Aphanomyces invadans]|uniref:Macro domain-containing protein n=1 Tax=Aphanomyces invadans TaxID=157072 RepID=A0A3R6WMC9_9STRA|nr:hypothetical protein DYB32_004491 [Aphanomyces invadans]
MPPISSMTVPAVHFRYDTGLNAKVALWNGSIWKLEVDAIVNSTNESLTDDTDVSGEVLKAAGNEIFTEIRSVGTCRTGDAVATRASHSMPCRKLIHTVGPRYNEKYRIAAENALHSSYRNCLRVAKEERAATVAFPCIYRKKKNYPRDDAVHVALRTIRRFLEHFGDAFDLIVLCVDDSNDFRLYHECLPLYFPRSVGEEIAATVALDTLSHINLGDEHGEPVIEERKIRISSIPFTQDGSDNDVDNSDSNQRRHDEDGSDRGTRSDFQDIARLGLIHRAGVDHAGAPVLMVVGKNLPSEAVDLDRVLLYVIHVMDAVVDRKRTIPSCLTLPRYRDNLKAFYILEATMWLKMTLWLAKAFVHNAFYAKVAYLDSIKALEQVAPSLLLPQDK